MVDAHFAGMLGISYGRPIPYYSFAATRDATTVLLGQYGWISKSVSIKVSGRMNMGFIGNYLRGFNGGPGVKPHPCSPVSVERKKEIPYKEGIMKDIGAHVGYKVLWGRWDRIW